MKYLILVMMVLLVGCYDMEEIEGDECEVCDTDFDTESESNDTALPTIWEVQQRFCDAMYDCGAEDCVETAILVNDCDTDDHYFKMCAREIDAIVCDGSVLIPQDCQQACR